MKKVILAAVIAGLTAPHGSSGTALFSSADIHRPLVPQSIPGPEVFQQLFPDMSKADLERSHKVVRHGWDYYSITEINDGSAWLWISELLEAVRINPRDPYAPCLLGAYLALHHKLEAAADATRESLLRLHALGPEAAGSLGDLHLRCGINLARYRLLLGDAEGALAELGELPELSQAQGPVAQKAYWWLSTLVLAEIGQTVPARGLLEEAKKIDSMKDRKEARIGSPLWNDSNAYPQYFEQAGAIERYLDALLLWKEGHPDEAITAMRVAVDAWSSFGIQSKFYDARTSLAIFLAETDHIAEAVEMLEKLRTAPLQGKMMRPETIAYNLALIQSNRGDLGEAERLYREAIRLTVERNCDYFKTLTAYVTEVRGCNLVEICEGFLKESHRCDLKKCASYGKKMSESQPAPPWLCESLRGQRFVAAHNNLGDVYLRQAGKAGSQPEKWLGQAKYQFRLALDGAEPGSEMWHRANVNLARAHLAGSDREGFLAALDAGLGQRSAPVLTYVSLLEPAYPRLYLDVVEDAWGQTLPAEVRSRLEVLASNLERQDRPAEDKVLSLRARRLLSPDASLAIPTLPPLAEGTELLRNALIQGDMKAGEAAVSQVQNACPVLLDNASACEGASPETARDAMFLNGLWYLEQDDKDRALAYFQAARRMDPSWPLSRRYLEQLQGSR